MFTALYSSRVNKSVEEKGDRTVIVGFVFLVSVSAMKGLKILFLKADLFKRVLLKLGVGGCHWFLFSFRSMNSEVGLGPLSSKPMGSLPS